MSLASTASARTVRITNVRSDGPMGLRLLELGLVEGATVEVLRRAPLGDPMHVRLGDCELSLRHSDAELIDVA